VIEMKILLVYYSRTHVTEKIAKSIQNKLNCDIEEITDGGKYNGKLGYMKGGMNASMRRTSKIDPISKNPSDYDLVIIGTPVWASNMATPIYSYLLKYKNDIPDIASFCTCISGGFEKTLQNIDITCGKSALAQMYLTSKDVENPTQKINNFINKINNIKK